MKKTKPSILILLALAGMTAASVAQSPSPAKLKSPAPAATPANLPAGDPFDKHQGGTPQADADNPVNICFTVEVYALAQDDAAKLLEENPGGEARHARVLELAGAGKARFETLLSDVTKSGQRSVIEQVDEFRYPTEFEPAPVPGDPVVPTAFEGRNTGDSMEIEPVLSPDRSVCDISMSLGSSHFLGFKEFRARPQDSPVAQPEFESRKFTTSMTLTPGKIHFLGTLSTPPQFANAATGKPDHQEVRLVFGRVSLSTRTRTAPPAEEEGTTLEHQLVTYSMDREAARQVLAGDSKPGGYYAAVRALADHRQARLERILVLKTKSGQRAVAEEIDEVRYPSEYSVFDASAAGQAKRLPAPGESPAVPAESPAAPAKTPEASQPAAKSGGHREFVPSSFETRNAGLMLEIEPVAGKSVVDLNLDPSMVTNIDSLLANGVAGKYPAQPTFETSNVITSLSASLGEYAFIGTFSPPGDTGVNGRKDTGRVWLIFIRTDYAEP